MNIKWTNITGFGPAAWNHGGQPLRIPSMTQQQKENEGLVFHPHEGAPGHRKRTDHSDSNTVRKTSHHDD